MKASINSSSKPSPIDRPNCRTSASFSSTEASEKGYLSTRSMTTPLFSRLSAGEKAKVDEAV
jgi:hypothetical protein